MTATSNTILDTGKFTKFPEGYKASGEYVPKRVAVPIEVQTFVTTSLLSDRRKQGDRYKKGDKPTKLEIFSQLIELGYQVTQSKARNEGGYDFSDDELQVPDITEDVIWLDKVVNEQVANILEAYNIIRDTAGQKRLRGTVPVVCALLRRGVSIAPKKDLT